MSSNNDIIISDVFISKNLIYSWTECEEYTVIILSYPYIVLVVVLIGVFNLYKFITLVTIYMAFQKKNFVGLLEQY